MGLSRGLPEAVPHHWNDLDKESQGERTRASLATEGERLPNPSVGTFRAPSHPEHDDDSSSVIDRVDDPQRADTDPQEVGTGQLGCAAGSRVEAEGENGTAELRRGARWQATEL